MRRNFALSGLGPRRTAALAAAAALAVALLVGPWAVGAAFPAESSSRRLGERIRTVVEISPTLELELSREGEGEQGYRRKGAFGRPMEFVSLSVLVAAVAPESAAERETKRNCQVVLAQVGIDVLNGWEPLASWNTEDAPEYAKRVQLELAARRTMATIEAYSTIRDAEIEVGMCTQMVRVQVPRSGKYTVVAYLPPGKYYSVDSIADETLGSLAVPVSLLVADEGANEVLAKKLMWDAGRVRDQDAAEALRLVDEGLKLDMDNVELHLLRGSLLFERQDRAGSLKAFRTAQTLLASETPRLIVAGLPDWVAETIHRVERGLPPAPPPH